MGDVANRCYQGRVGHGGTAAVGLRAASPAPGTAADSACVTGRGFSASASLPEPAREASRRAWVGYACALQLRPGALQQEGEGRAATPPGWRRGGRRLADKSNLATVVAYAGATDRFGPGATVAVDGVEAELRVLEGVK